MRLIRTIVVACVSAIGGVLPAHASAGSKVLATDTATIESRVAAIRSALNEAGGLQADREIPPAPDERLQQRWLNWPNWNNWNNWANWANWPNWGNWNNY